MPSWKIHRKYGELLGINREIQKLVDEYIDSKDHHDFYDFFTEKIQTPKLRFLNDKRVVLYYFDSSSFVRSEFGKRIEMFGEDGIKCFFLHMFLDIIERRMRYKDSPDLIGFDIYGSGYRTIFEEVKKFVEENYHWIIEDIKKEKFRKRNKLKIEHGMLKGRYKSAVLSTLFRGMVGVVYSYGPKPAYYRRIIKESGVDYFIRELKSHGDYSIFVSNLLRNFERFYDEDVFPEISEILKKYSANEIVENESLLREFLKRIFKTH